MLQFVQGTMAPGKLVGRRGRLESCSFDGYAVCRVIAVLCILLLMTSGATMLARRKQSGNSPMTLPADLDATIVQATTDGNFALLEDLAKIADALRKYDVEARLLEMSLIIRGNVSGQMSTDYGVGFRKLGDYWRDQNDFANAMGFYEKALPLLADGPEAATTLIHMGILGVGNQNYSKAADYLNQASSKDSSKTAQANMWLAINAQAQGNLTDAESFYRSSLAMQDPNTPAAATGMELLASLLRQENHLNQAKSFQDQAVAARKLQSPQVVAVVSGNDLPAPTPNLLKITGSVKPPVVVSRMDPVYPEEARIANYRGTVVVSCEIWPDGLAHNIRIVQGRGFGLSEKAAEAVSQWKFRPATKNGQPVAVAQTISISFR
jgi:TonB family protein